MELDVGQPILLAPAEARSSATPRIGGSRSCATATSWSRRGRASGRRRDGASPHVHRTHCDLFFVLEGELTFLVGPEPEEHVLPAGTLALAPPLVVHGFRNGGDEELRYLNFHAPGGGFADYLRGVTPGLRPEDPPADGGRPVTRRDRRPAREPAASSSTGTRSGSRCGTTSPAASASCLPLRPRGRTLLEIRPSPHLPRPSVRCLGMRTARHAHDLVTLVTTALFGTRSPRPTSARASPSRAPAKLAAWTRGSATTSSWTTSAPGTTTSSRRR